MQNFEYLNNEKFFLVKQKAFFCNYLRAVIWWKQKWKIEDTSFKGSVRYIFASSVVCLK